MSFGLSEATHISFNRAFSQFPEIEEVLIYGSRAKGTFRLGSDIDLTLIGKTTGSLNQDTLSKVWLAIDNLEQPRLVSIYETID